MSPGWSLDLHRFGPQTPGGPPGLSVASLTALEPALSLGRLDALPVELSVEILGPRGERRFQTRAAHTPAWPAFHLFAPGWSPIWGCGEDSPRVAEQRRIPRHTPCLHPKSFSVDGGLRLSGGSEHGVNPKPYSGGRRRSGARVCRTRE